MVFVLEPFHCVEAFEILADHVLFFSWVTSCKLYWCRVGHVFVNSKVALKSFKSVEDWRPMMAGPGISVTQKDTLVLSLL